MTSDNFTPTYALQLPQHLLDNCRVLSCRADILPLLPENIVFCEIGVALGEFSAKVLATCKIKTFYALDLFVLHTVPDLWDGHVGRELGDDLHLDYYRNKFKKEIDAGIMRPIMGDSALGLAQVPDNTVDVFYVDANHQYQFVKNELQIIKRKMKPDSLIILNDYIMQVNNTGYGVVQATNEFMVKENMEMIYFALHTAMYCDVAIRYKR